MSAALSGLNIFQYHTQGVAPGYHIASPLGFKFRTQSPTFTPHHKLSHLASPLSHPPS